MPKYKVRENENIIHDNVQYGPSDTFTCTEKQAALLRVDIVDGAKEKTETPKKLPAAER